MKWPEIKSRLAMKRGPILIALVILLCLIAGSALSPWSPIWKQQDVNRAKRNQLKALEAMLEQNAISYQTKVVSEMLKGVLVAKADFVGRWANGMKIDTTGTFLTNQTFGQMPVTFPIAAGSWWRVINDSCLTTDGEMLSYVKSYDPADRTGPVTECFVLPFWFRGILAEDLEKFDEQLAQEAEARKVQQTSTSTAAGLRPFPILVSNLVVNHPAPDLWQFDLPGSTGNGSTGILLKPGSSLLVEVYGRVNIGSDKSEADIWVGPNGWLNKSAWFSYNRTNHMAWPGSNCVNESFYYLGAVVYRLGDDQRWSFLGEKQIITNTSSVDRFLFIAVCDDFLDEQGRYHPDWQANNRTAVDEFDTGGSEEGLSVECTLLNSSNI